MTGPNTHNPDDEPDDEYYPDEDDDTNYKEPDEDYYEKMADKQIHSFYNHLDYDQELYLEYVEDLERGELE